jgi:N-acetylglucosamine transport system permease protein
VKIVTICSSIFIAAVLTRETLVGAGWYRFVLYLPSVLSIVVVAAIFSAVFDQNNGLVNGLLQALGLGHGPVWLGDQNVVMYSVAIAMVWQSLGYYVVLYMAGMSSVPVEIYESASLDGAGRMTQLGSITIPLIWSNIRTTLTFFVLSSVNLAFVLVKALTDGGPNGSSEVLLNYMYKQAFTNSAYGYGMAIGVVTFLFSFLVAMLISHVTRREVLQYS